MKAAVRAGILYFAIVFAVGFALGALRVLVVAPVTGEFAAVAVELPAMLAVSWVACGRVLRRCDVGAGCDVRTTMCLVAFGLLMIAEFLLWAVLLDRTSSGFFARYAEPAAALGLAAQIAFGAMPLFRR